MNGCNSNNYSNASQGIIPREFLTPSPTADQLHPTIIKLEDGLEASSEECTKLRGSKSLVKNILKTAKTENALLQENHELVKTRDPTMAALVQDIHMTMTSAKNVQNDQLALEATMKISALQNTIKTLQKKSDGLEKELKNAQDLKKILEMKCAKLQNLAEPHRVHIRGLQKKLDEAKKFQETLTADDVKLVQERIRAEAEIQKIYGQIDVEKRQLAAERARLRIEKENVVRNQERVRLANQRLTEREQRVSKAATKRDRVELMKDREEFEKMKREFMVAMGQKDQVLQPKVKEEPKEDQHRKRKVGYTGESVAVKKERKD